MPNKPKKNIMKEFIIAEISGVDDPAQAGAVMSIMKSKSGKPPVKKKEGPMPKTAEELQAELTKSAADLEKANGQIEDLTKKAETAAKLAELTDAEKSFYADLSDDAKEVFLGKSKDARKEEVEAAIKNKEADDPVIFKSANGTEYRKSDDARLVEMAKQNDAREAEVKKMRDDAANAAFEKSASVDFAKFKGELPVKTALAKAVAGIKDEETRNGVKEMLKAAHAAVGLTLKEVGSGHDDYTSDDAGGDSMNKAKAEAKLDEMAKKYATENKVDYSKAYTAVLETADGQKLYAETV